MDKETKSINAQMRAGTFKRNEEIRKLAKILGNGYEELAKQFNLTRQRIFKIATWRIVAVKPKKR